MAAKPVKVTWIETNCNISDAITKRLTYNKTDCLFGDWTY